MRNKGGRGVKKLAKKGGQWSDEALKFSINALDSGHNITDVYKKFEIPRSTLKEQFGQTKIKKIRAKMKKWTLFTTWRKWLDWFAL